MGIFFNDLQFVRTTTLSLSISVDQLESGGIERQNVFHLTRIFFATQKRDMFYDFFNGFSVAFFRRLPVVVLCI